MDVKKTAYWFRDRCWPLLEPLTEVRTPPNIEWKLIPSPSLDVLETAYAFLKDEFKTDLELVRIVDSKLQSISSLSPIAITVIVAMVAFLTGGRVGEFTKTSTLVLEVLGFYVALQFVRALLAATKGLGRAGYYFATPKDIPPKVGETKETYIRRVCEDLSDSLVRNREATNRKVEQLALGHEALTNAIFGLLGVIFVLLLVTIFGRQP
jgi:hypothetical protein